MNYLVTGGAGFIGSNIAKHLVEKGESVRVLDNFFSGKKENLADIIDKIDFVEGDITDLETCKKVSADMDYVLHQAAIPSVPRSVDQPLQSNEANVTGTLNILYAARDAKVKRVVYAGSSSAYGDVDIPVKTEELLPRPLSPYAASKLAGEYYCKVFYNCYGLETVVVRYFNVFGPQQDPNSQYSAVIPKFITSVLKDEQPTIYGDGLQSRDFTYVENNISGNILAATSKKGAGEVFNIACGGSFDLVTLMKIINETLGKDIKPIFAPTRKGDVKHSLAGIKKAEEILGFKVIVDFKEGMRRTIDWYKKQQ